MKKLAVVASGWHYPASFYEDILKQKLPKDWKMDLFCVSHRDPSFAIEEKKNKVFEGPRAYLDEKLYSRIITKDEIEALGWNYKEYPNTIGDWGNSNQWLDDHDYKEYDMFLFTHDDNLIIHDQWFNSVLRDSKGWEILSNSDGMPSGWIRGSCEFFKRSFLEKIGGKFDLSKTTLTREGKTTTTEDVHELYDWNTTVEPLMKFIEDNKIMVGYLSPSYRVSMFVIEGERGYISNTHGQNTAKEDAGLEFLKQHKLI